jgi:hypothetical protein
MTELDALCDNLSKNLSITDTNVEKECKNITLLIDNLMISIMEVKSAQVLKTEDTGKTLEYAICLTYNTPYNGPFKYSVEEAQALVPRLKTGLIDDKLFPKCTHTAENGSRYDYTADDDKSQHLSAKSTKGKVRKIAPQVIGQPTPKKFCDLLEVKFTDVATLKKYIQENVNTILPVLDAYTFDSPIVYYNKKFNTIQFIKVTTPIVWSNYQYSWTTPYSKWTNSTTLHILTPGQKSVPLVEFQFHSTRKNMAIRWCFDGFLNFFQNNLTICNF